MYLLNFSTPFDTSANFSEVFKTISKAPNNGAANNFGPQYYDGAMFANDGEWYTYGGLLSLTDSQIDQSATIIEGYEAYSYGAAKRFYPGFIQQNLPNGITRYVTDGAGVSVPSQNMGYYFGGLRAADFGQIYYPTGNETINADVLSDTLISVDLSTQGSESWTNTTLPSTIPGRVNAEIVWVPVGASGILIAIGGVVDPVYDTATMLDNSTQRNESVCSFYFKICSLYKLTVPTANTKFSIYG